MAEARIDQSVRIFKSRTQAGAACKKGKVSINGQVVKPSAQVNLEDHIKVEKNRYEYQFIVRKIINKRVGAPAAVLCYKDITPEEELKKFDRWFVGKAKGEFRERGTGRPTKKDRREIERFKDL